MLVLENGGACDPKVSWPQFIWCIYLKAEMGLHWNQLNELPSDSLKLPSSISLKMIPIIELATRLSLHCLTNAVLAMVKAAFDAIDFEMHCGSHPRLGVVDHITFHPLADASLDQTARTARYLATNVGFSLQGLKNCNEAHEEGRTLDLIRRELGYFKPNSSGNLWIGGLKSDILPLKPDSGPAQVSPRNDVVVIGSTNWVDNYNVPLFSSDIGAVRKIAKQVSGRGGGLPSVQAMALAHGQGVIEVA